MTGTVIAVVVTHRRIEELGNSLKVLAAQSRSVDHLIVVDNDADPRVGELVAAQPIPSTYLASRRNLGAPGALRWVCCTRWPPAP